MFKEWKIQKVGLIPGLEGMPPFSIHIGDIGSILEPYENLAKQRFGCCNTLDKLQDCSDLTLKVRQAEYSIIALSDRSTS